MTGTFYGIGVGPGDPELLTLKAVRVLGEVNVLAVPKSRRERRSIALEIVSARVKKDWSILELYLPMTRDREELEEHWERAARDVLSRLQGGDDVAFITLGDPTIYSTFTYLLKKVKGADANIKVELIPGISAINAVSSWIQKPLCEGDESLAIIPAIKSERELGEVLQSFDNVVFMKAGKQFEKLYSALRKAGLEKKAVFISRYGFEDGFHTEELGQLRDKDLDYLSTVVVKKGAEK